MNINKNKKVNSKSLENGFSLIEILVVLMIIGMLTAVVAINVLPSQDRARVDKAKADIRIIAVSYTHLTLPTT